MNDNNACRAPNPLPVEAIIIEPGGNVEHHRLVFDWDNQGERWAFEMRIEHCLRNAYGLALAPLSPQAARLAQRKAVA